MGRSRPLSVLGLLCLTCGCECVCRLFPSLAGNEGETQHTPRLTPAVEHPRWEAWGQPEREGQGGEDRASGGDEVKKRMLPSKQWKRQGMHQCRLELAEV